MKYFIVFLIVFLISIQAQNNIDYSEYKIAYSSDKDGNPDIFLTDINGVKTIRITDNKLRDGYPACSPDGKKIAYYAYFDRGKTWSIFIMNRDGSDKKRLTKKKFVLDAMPRWSKDGKLLTFSRSSSDWKNNEIWVMNADGTNQRKINNIKGFTPSFTKNGNIIFYTHWEKTGEIFIANLEGEILKQITTNDYMDGKPDISPDGNKIVFQSKKYGNSEIYLMDINGKNRIKLSTNSEMQHYQPRWSPDGSKILFSALKNGNYEVYVMDSDGSNVKKITNSKAKDGQATWLY